MNMICFIDKSSTICHQDQIELTGMRNNEPLHKYTMIFKFIYSKTRNKACKLR